MNIKLNVDENPAEESSEPAPYSSAEERRRTGRYIAISVGISLVCLAMYHAWERKVPVLASLLIPALIMLLYIAWVLYTASRDKKKEMNAEMDAEAAHPEVQEAPPEPPPPATPQQPPAQGPTTSKQFRRCYSIA